VADIWTGDSLLAARRIPNWSGHVTRPATLTERLASFGRAYVEAARIIASDPERYGGALAVGAARILQRTDQREAT
jgi:hypothetical protein